MRCYLPLLLCCLLAACAENPPLEAPPPKAEPEPAKIESQPLKYMHGRTFKPQPTRELNVRSRCAHRDAVGTRTKLELLVKNAEVKSFNAEITISKRGTCRFDFKNFSQKEKMPQVILSAKDCLLIHI